MNFYIAFSVCEKGKNWAGTMTVTSSENIRNLSARVSGKMTAAQLCPTKKCALQLADFWNECFKKNGTSIYL